MVFQVVDWSPEFDEVRLERARIVEVERDFGHEQDKFSGVLLASSASAKLYLAISDLIMANGVSLIRPRDVVAEMTDPVCDFYRSVLLAKLDGVLPRAPRLPDPTFPGLCRWLQKAVTSAAFFEETIEDAGCQVGRVSSVTPDSVVLDTVTAAGEPDGEWGIPFDQLTRIDCLGEYERSFDLIRPS